MKAITSNGVEINTGEPVLVRDNTDEKWKYSIFSHIEQGWGFPYKTATVGYKYCIPYENNEHLVGTTDNYKVFKKEKKSLTYKEKQERWVKKHKVKAGDLVKITKASYKGDNDWEVPWSKDMNQFIGKIAKIVCICKDSVKLDTGMGFWYPYHILEKVEDDFKFGAKIRFMYNGKEKEGFLINYTHPDDPCPYFVTWLNENSDIGRTSRTWVKEITYID